MWYNSLCLRRWLPHRFLKRHSLLSTVIFRTTLTRTIMFNLLMKWLLGSSLSHVDFKCEGTPKFTLPSVFSLKNHRQCYYILVYLLWSLTEQYTTSGRPSFLRAMRSERKGKIMQTNGKKGGATVVSHGSHRSPLDRALVSRACIQPCLKIKIRDYLQSNCTDTCRSATCVVINVRKCRRYRPFALN